MILKLHEHAEEDLLLAEEFYETQSVGLGDYSLIQIDAILDQRFSPKKIRKILTQKLS